MAQVEKNGSYRIEITGMTHEGQGVGRIDNFTVFVDGAIEGEAVEARIVKVTKSYAVGKLMKILRASPERTAPFCPVFNRCGGCSLQHMRYEAQLAFKTNVVREAVRRIGKLEEVRVHETIGMERAFNYRNKAQFPVGMGNEAPVIGFYAARSHDIIDCESCGIQDALSDKVRTVVRKFAADKKISLYDEKSQKGLLRHVMTRVGFKTGEVMVVIVINGNELPHAKELADRLTAEVPGIKSILLNINTRNTNVILGEQNRKIYGSETIVDFIGSYKFEISPLSFFQVNPLQTEVLYGKAMEYAQLTGSETVFDLYCGIGTIALFLSGKAKKIYGVEVVEPAVKDARRNAELNGVTNVEFLAGAAEEVVPRLYAQGIRADVVVVDPPRKGCDEKLLETLVDMNPLRIVYVSCNPATLARDLNYLAGRGFKAVEIQPVDMFPWTGHTETIVRLEQLKP